MGQRQSSGKGKPGQRLIKVDKNYMKRFDKETLTILKSEFERVQEAGTISYAQFQHEILGAHVPDCLGSKLYIMFASPIVQPAGKQQGLEDSSKLTINQQYNPQQLLQQSNQTVSHVMTFEDFCALYTTFRDNRDDEMMQVIFQLIFMNRHMHQRNTQQSIAQNNQHHQDSENETENSTKPLNLVSQTGRKSKRNESINQSDLQWLALLIQGHDKMVQEYFLTTSFAPNVPITFDDFSATYKQVKHYKIFNFVHSLASGYSDANMNLELENESKNYERRMTIQISDKQKLALVSGQPSTSAIGAAAMGVANANGENGDGTDAAGGGNTDQSNVPVAQTRSARLSSMEVDNIREFWNNDIKNKPAADVHQLFRKMFKDMKVDKLRKYIFQSVSQVVGLTFMFLAELVLNICKQTSAEQRLTFLFNIFAKQQKQMRGKAIKDFIDIFHLPMQIFKLATFLTLEQFLDELCKVDMDFSPLLAARPMMIAMTAVTPETDDEERAAILAALNGHRNLETFIYETLPEEQEYYVIEKDFWDQWCTALAINSEGMYSIKKEHKDFIDNKSLMEEMHTFRMKDLTYKQDFVLLPKYVYYPLSKWYSCEKEITRSVIQYRRDKKIAGGGALGSDLIGASGAMQSLNVSRMDSHRFMMSSQKFYNPKEQQFEEELVHKKGEFVYELEIYPQLLYLAMVSDKGEKPYVKAVINGKVDFNYLRKVVHTDSLPFEELQVSRKTSLFQVLQIAAQTFSQNIKRGRLLIEDQIVHGTKLYQTLEDYGLRQGQLVFAEFCNSSNEYPTDLIREKQRKSQSPKKQAKTQSSMDSFGNTTVSASTIGLQNLGNTCYMNSALQVIANLKAIHEYFITQKLHEKQTNLRNVMGFKGNLVYPFSQLLKLMWSSSSPIMPRHFKIKLGECCEQFIGYDQQDSQEYISFLIDGLHEELNLRMKKPYIQNPESKNRDINELGLEQWSNSLLRNWSIIYFLFYGQMRSTISCRQCNTASTTFDIFSNVPLSLPEPSQQTVSIIVYRMPNRVKDILQNKTVKDENGNITLQGFQRLDSNTERDSESGAFSMQNSNMGGLQRLHSSQSNRDRQHLAQFAESYNYMNNDQPMHIMLKVDVDIKIGDLITKIGQIRELNIEMPLEKTEIVLYLMGQHGNLLGIMNPDVKLNQYMQNEWKEIFASEILARPGRDIIKKFYMDNSQFLRDHPGTVMRCLTYASEKGDKMENIDSNQLARSAESTGNMQHLTPGQIQQHRQYQQQQHQQQVPQAMSAQAQAHVQQVQQQQQRPITGESEYDSSEQSSSQMSQIRGLQRRVKPTVDKYRVIHLVMTKPLNQFHNVEVTVDLPRDMFVVAYNRRFIKKSEYLFNQYVPQLIANPLIFCMPKYPSGRRIYDEVWASAHVFLKPNSKFHRQNSRWWERKDWKKIVESKSGIYAPFVLKMVEKDGIMCSQCHWTKKCTGCIILPHDAPIYEEQLLTKCFLAIEWHSKSLTESYNPIANEVVEHASTRKKANEILDQSNYTTLDDCLTKFHKTEQLENEVNCEKCKSNQVHYKSMKIFIPPPILIIQLKRFRLFGNQWRKLQNLVDFPIRNLDISQFVSDPAFIKKYFNIEPTYNLHGIVNHFGQLGFGHYVSYTRNHFEEKWYRYDDLYREEVNENKINKESAYLLFYIRKDMETKDLAQVMPDIEKDFFVGKPIKINNQEGFITENPKATPDVQSVRGRSEVTIKLKSQPQKSSVSTADLVAEEDRSEITYTQPEMRHLYKIGRTLSADHASLKDGRKSIMARTCCKCAFPTMIKRGSSSLKPKASTLIANNRRGNIKQSSQVISQLKRVPTNQQGAAVANSTANQQQTSGGDPKQHQVNRRNLQNAVGPSVDQDSSIHSSSVAQPLIKVKQTTPSDLGQITAAVSSPKVVASARNIVQEERQLQFVNQKHHSGLEKNENNGRSVVQSQEGALNVVPRPRFKMPEGMMTGEQPDSDEMSRYSHSEHGAAVASEGQGVHHHNQHQHNVRTAAAAGAMRVAQTANTENYHQEANNGGVLPQIANNGSRLRLSSANNIND